MPDGRHYRPADLRGLARPCSAGWRSWPALPATRKRPA